MIDRGIGHTEALWPPIEKLHAHLRRVGEILANKTQKSAAGVRRAMRRQLATMKSEGVGDEFVRQALDHFAKVTASYWPGLFHTYQVPGLGRTNNATEQFFGAWRWHERRATGRKRASRTEVLLGQASLASSLATRKHPLTGEDLAQVDLARWHQTRQLIAQRRAAFKKRRAFRRKQGDYLAQLTERTIKLTLLP